MEWIVAVITICAAVVTIVWFIKDIRKENSKTLKAILEAQNFALKIEGEQAEIMKGQSQILEKIEEGQRRGFETLSQILVKIEDGQRRGFETLAQLLVKVGAK